VKPCSLPNADRSAHQAKALSKALSKAAKPVTFDAFAGDLDYPEPPTATLRVGDIIRATYYNTGLSIPANHIGLSGGWGGYTYVFEIQRIEPGMWGHRQTHVIAAEYWKRGSRATAKSGIFILLEPAYELIQRAEHSFTMNVASTFIAPQRLLGTGERVDEFECIYEEPE
jgi:hypothetical protein